MIPITRLFKVQMGYKRQYNTMILVSTAQQEGDLSSGIWNQTPADIQTKTNRRQKEKTQCSSKGCARAHAYAAVLLNEACCDRLLQNVYDSKTENNCDCEIEQMMCWREVNNATSCDRLQNTFRPIDF